MPKIALARIVISESRRTLRDISALAQSIQDLGLINPITVTANGDEFFHLVAGRHRLEAARSLGWTEIDASILECGELEAELAEIDENLCRTELTAMERMDQLKRRKEIYETLHPETKHGGAPGSNRGKKPRKPKDDKMSSFGEDTAKKAKVSVRTVERAVEVATNLTDEAKDLLRETATADNQSALAAIAKEDGKTQKAIASKIASGEAKSVKQAKEMLGKAPAKKSDDVVDALDQPVPKEFRAAFATRKEFGRIGREINKLVREATELAEGPGGRFLVANSFDSDMKNAKRQLDFAIPHAVCVYCDGSGKKDGKDCTGCRGGGWMPRSIYNSAPKDLKGAK